MNDITTLRNHLFSQLDKLKKSTGEELKEEIEKTKAIVSISTELINSATCEAMVARTVNELPSGFIPTTIGHVINKMVEESKTPYVFDKGEMDVSFKFQHPNAKTNH